MATLAVEAGSRNDSFVAEAAGPEVFTFEELLRLLAEAVGARVRLVHTPPSLGFGLTKLVGLLPRDVVLSRDEVDALMAGLLTTGAAPTGITRFGDWLADNRGVLGQRHSSELRRNYRRKNKLRDRPAGRGAYRGKGGRTMNEREPEEGSYPELFPEDFGERLERLIELAGLSREEFAERLGIEYDRVVEWFDGAILTGGEVWHVARLAWSVPGGLEAILPGAGGGTE